MKKLLKIAILVIILTVSLSAFLSCDVLNEYLNSGSQGDDPGVTPHDHDYEVVLSKYPTCTEAGYTEKAVCKICGDTIEAEKEIPAIGHIEEKTPGKAPTCTEAGISDEVKCSVCGEILAEQREIPALGHFEETITGKAPTCTEAGLSDGAKCSVCGEIITAQTVMDALGHKPETVPGKEATCTETGLTEGSKCSVCGDVLTAKEEIPALGHKPETVPGKEATCTESGLTEGSECSVCGEELAAQEEIPALGHKPETVPGKEATCTETGLTDGSECSVCGEELAAQEEIPALGHSEGEWIIDADATCTAEGSKHTVCTACEITLKTEVIPMINHSHTSAVTAPTCTAQGYTTYTCHCGDTYKGNYVNALGHTFGENDICSVCGSQKPSEGLEFSLNSDNKSYSVSGLGDCTDLNIIVPSVYNGYSVTGIDSHAFKGCSGLTSITIPDSVTSIGSDAFSRCSSLYVIYNNSSLTLTFGSIDNGDVAYYAKAIIDNDGNVTYNNTSSTTYTLTDDGFLFGYYNSKYTLIAYTGGEETVTLPTDINGEAYEIYEMRGVVNVIIPEGIMSIGEDAFYNCTSLTSITIPDSLTSIGDYAFRNCTGLTSITIPDSVTSIGWYAFNGCSSLESITLPFVGTTKDGTSDTHFGYIFGADSYGKNSSNVPSSLKTVVITGSTRIGSSAFFGCSSLTSITIPDSVTSIGSSAFSGCTSLTSITIPDSVTRIGSSAFYSCSSLTIYVETESKPNGWNNNWNSSYRPVVWNFKELYVDDQGIVYALKNDNTVTVASFTGDATEIVILNNINGCSVISINEYAFYNCTNLTGITIPDSVLSLGDFAFCGCSSLTNITIHDSVISIGFGAFRDCSGLTSATISGSVTSIGGYAFENCSSLTVVHITDISAWCAIDFDGIYANPLYYTKNLYLNGELVSGDIVLEGITRIGSYALYNYTGITSITIPEGVTSIGSGAFSGCSGLTSITIPASVTSIGEDAFYNCTSLTSITVDGNNGNYKSIDGNLYTKDGTTLIQYAIGKTDTSFTIPEGVTSIGYMAFYNCTSLTSIEITDSVTSIGEDAFYNCTSLTSVTISGSVTSIGYRAFYKCSSLNAVYITDISKWCAIDFDGSSANPLYYAKNLYLNGELVTELVIPEGVTSINDYAFYNCTILISVTIPDSVTSIGYQAFYGCSGLISITIPDSVTSIGSYAFSGCSNLASITIPDSVTSIGNEAFYNCLSLTSITIPNSVTSIGSYAFQYCSSLESITLPFVGATKDGTSNTHFGYIFGTSSYSENSKYVPKSLKTVVITGGTSIGYYAFYDCSSLISITIPEGVTSIGDYAFYNCSSLTSITIPDSVTSIGYSAFSDCSSLTSITIPEGVASIGPWTFAYCSSLTSITIPESVTSIDDYALYKCSSLTSITVDESNTNYKSIDGNLYTKDGKTLIQYAIGKTDTSFTIPEGVTSIGSNAFNGCSSLTSITIPDSVTSIGKDAFYDSSLYVVYNNSTLTLAFGSSGNGYVAYYAKVMFDKDGNVTYKEESGTTYTLTDDGFLFKYYNSKYTLIAYIGGEEAVTLPSNINGEAYGIYQMRGVVNVIIPEGLTSIGSSAFYGCTSLVSVTIPDSVTSIGDYAFLGCRSLVSVTIPDSVTSIGSYAFNGCTNIIQIENSVSYVDKWVVYCDTSVASVVLRSDTVGIGDDAFYYCSSLTSITIPDSIITIGNFAFYECSGLTSITIPNSVTSIGSSAFSDCSSLTAVHITDISKWCAIDFGNSYANPLRYAKNLYLNGELVSGDIVLEGITSIGMYALYNQRSITSITIPDSVTSIGFGAFDDCYSLKVYITDISKWCAIDFGDNPLDYLNNELYLNGELVSGDIVLEGITSIGDDALCNQTGITSIIIPEGVTSIGSGAFSGCSSLTSITIPEGVTGIGSGAFNYCSSLASITIPDSVTSIGNGAFYLCHELTSITYEGTIAEWSSIPKGENWDYSTGSYTVYCTDGEIAKQ